LPADPVRAAVTVSKETVEYQERPDPVASAGHALVSIRHLTLCGTDLHIWEDDYAAELPIIQGHEFVGLIEELSEADAARGGFSVGDRVAVSPMFYCGTCYACRVGRVNSCRRMSVYGCYEDGALTTLMSIPLEKLYPVPANLPLEIAPLCEPMSIAMQAVNRGRPVAGENALVLGSGPIGLLATMYLLDLGVHVIAADTVAGRCEFARRFGARDTILIDPEREFPTPEAATMISAWTDGDGPSLVIEATGQPSSLQTALGVVSTAGRIVLVGISDREARLSMRVVPVKEVDLIGSRNSMNLIGEALEMIDRHQSEARSLITHRFDFDDLNAAFETMRSHTERVGKVAIDMPASRR
jgi:Threonine dehydrogenase and related Zn-dependent dehydrogenases